MDARHAHEELIEGFYGQLKAIFENSDQAMYLYLDDVHTVCNDRLADLLGLDSPDDWASADPSPMVFVAPKSRQTLVTAYQNAMERYVGSAINVTWQRKSGGTVDTKVILVPISYEGHLFALHFISPS